MAMGATGIWLQGTCHALWQSVVTGIGNAYRTRNHDGKVCSFCSTVGTWVGTYTGTWDSSEEGRLVQIIQDLGEEGTWPQAEDISWKEVEKRMDNTRSAHQCRNRWYVLPYCLVRFTITIYRIDCVYPRLQNGGKQSRWSYTDSFILVQK
jgi:Myb-like DNA-binding domain